ncbi:hypothetical protein J6O48_04485 [bacterium]|nr:hypothetical protein [bacterium]
MVNYAKIEKFLHQIQTPRQVLLNRIILMNQKALTEQIEAITEHDKRCLVGKNFDYFY